MKFGVREICDVVLKAKAKQQVGNKTFFKGEPVIYFDTLKTSSMEGAATTVYAQGGRGNSRLMAWEGERTVTFTMEDALISPAGFMILSGAGLIQGSQDNLIPVHVHETTQKFFYGDKDNAYVITDQTVSQTKDAKFYVMTMKDGDIISEPFIAEKAGRIEVLSLQSDEKLLTALAENKVLHIKKSSQYNPVDLEKYFSDKKNIEAVMVDYYTDKASEASQIEITPDKFGGNYYLEASTLFKNTAGVDMPAEFVIPNCKVQSNFSFSMASTGDPSTFTFTLDAFPDYTNFNKEHKVLAAIQIIDESAKAEENDRTTTDQIDVEDSKVETVESFEIDLNNGGYDDMEATSGDVTLVVNNDKGEPQTIATVTLSEAGSAAVLAGKFASVESENYNIAAKGPKLTVTQPSGHVKFIPYATSYKLNGLKGTAPVYTGIVPAAEAHAAASVLSNRSKKV